MYTQISFSLYGRGLRSSGPSSLLVSHACICICVYMQISFSLFGKRHVLHTHTYTHVHTHTHTHTGHDSRRLHRHHHNAPTHTHTHTIHTHTYIHKTHTQVMIAEDCTDTNTMLPGGEPRPVACLFDQSIATVEFTLRRPTNEGRLCYRTTSRTRAWQEFLPNTFLQCAPTQCGAATCQANSNFLYDGSRDFACDPQCCFSKCESDVSCR